MSEFVDLTSHRIEGLAVHGNTPFSVPLVSEVGAFKTGLLLHGGCKDGVEIDVDVIVSLYPWERYDSDAEIQLALRMYDASGQVPEYLVEYAADQVAFWLERGQRVLVHCQAGLNRSSLVVGYYLIKHEGMSPVAAVELIRRKRSTACLCNSDFERFLLDLKPVVG